MTLSHFLRTFDRLSPRTQSMLWWYLLIPPGIVIAFMLLVPTVVSLAVAAFGSGTLLGFLFGIPRVLPGAAAKQDDYRISPNTNLEQISDWLTKIIVGVGLVELRQIPTHFESLVLFVASNNESPAVVGSVMVSFAVFGFLVSFLATRLKLGQAFRDADNAFSQLAEELRSETTAPSSAPPGAPPPAAPPPAGPPPAGPPPAGLPPEGPPAQESSPEGSGSQLPRPQLAEDAFRASLGWFRAILRRESGELAEPAIIARWSSLVSAAQLLLVAKFPHEVIPPTISLIIDKLLEAKLITSQQASLFSKLTSMRNIVVHNPSSSVSDEDAKSFLETARYLEEQLNERRLRPN